MTNVDRTARNPNLLKWHRELYFIDHGAALYFHHNWQNVEEMSASRFTAIRSHVLLPWASAVEDAYAEVFPNPNYRPQTAPDDSSRRPPQEEKP